MTVQEMIDRVCNGDTAASVIQAAARSAMINEKVTLRTNHYKNSNLKDPSGKGNWIFSVVDPIYGKKIDYSPNSKDLIFIRGTKDFRVARKEAEKEATARGATEIWVMP